MQKKRLPFIALTGPAFFCLEIRAVDCHLSWRGVATPAVLPPPATFLAAHRERGMPPGPAKRPDLKDVLFSGGLVRLGGGRAELYVGAGDAEVYRVKLPDPFEEYENLEAGPPP